MLKNSKLTILFLFAFMLMSAQFNAFGGEVVNNSNSAPFVKYDWKTDEGNPSTGFVLSDPEDFDNDGQKEIVALNGGAFTHFSRIYMFDVATGKVEGERPLIYNYARHLITADVDGDNLKEIII